MSFYYFVYGLRLVVNRPLPGLFELTPSDKADVKVCLQPRTRWVEEIEPARESLRYVSNEGDDGDPSLKVWTLKGGEYFRFEYADSASFLIDKRGTEIWASWAGQLTLDDIAVYLQGPILGFLLRLRGRICLHASAIAVGRKAIALLGPSGAGKSTAAAAFANQGYPIMSDDVVGFRDEGNTFWVQPGYPRLRLWPTAVGALYDHEELLPRLTASWNKRYLDLTSNGYRFQHAPVPLAAIYILGERTGEPTAPYIESVSPQFGFASLVKNVYTNHLSNGEMRSREFPSLGRLAAAVPIRRANAHHASARLSRLCEVILDDFHTIQSQTTQT